VALVLSALSLLLTLALRLVLVWPTQADAPEQQAEAAASCKQMLKITLACLAVSILLWLMATHLSANDFNRVCLIWLLAIPTVGKLLRRLNSSTSVGGRR